MIEAPEPLLIAGCPLAPPAPPPTPPPRDAAALAASAFYLRILSEAL